MILMKVVFIGQKSLILLLSCMFISLVGVDGSRVYSKVLSHVCSRALVVDSSQFSEDAPAS